MKNREKKKNKWLFKIFIGVTIIFIAHYFITRRNTVPKMTPEMIEQIKKQEALDNTPVSSLKGSVANKKTDLKQKSAVVSSPSQPINTLHFQEKIKKEAPSISDEKYKLREEEIKALLEKKKSDRRVPRKIFADINTTFGTITIRLIPQIAPKTVENFVGLVEGTIKSKDPETSQMDYRRFYDGLTFHRVIKGYFIQTGAPRVDGSGGAGYIVPDEFNTRSTEIRPGMVIMANAGKSTASSQFFITVSDMRGMLDDNNTVFGKVVDGDEVLKKISEVRVNGHDKPVEEIKITEIKIRRIYAPKKDALSPAPTP